MGLYSGRSALVKVLISVYACACICEGDYKSARAKTVLVPVLEYQYVNVLVSGGGIIM